MRKQKKKKKNMMTREMNLNVSIHFSLSKLIANESDVFPPSSSLSQVSYHLGFAPYPSYNKMR